MAKKQETLDKTEIDQRRAVRKFKKTDGHKAYRDRKAWDYGRVGTEQVLDMSRLQDRKRDNASKSKKS